MTHAARLVESPVSDERIGFRRTAAETTAVCCMLALLLLASCAGISPAIAATALWSVRNARRRGPPFNPTADKE